MFILYYASLGIIVIFPEKQQDQQDRRTGNVEVFTGELFINNKSACFFKLIDTFTEATKP